MCSIPHRIGATAVALCRSRGRVRLFSELARDQDRFLGEAPGDFDIDRSGKPIRSSVGAAGTLPWEPSAEERFLETCLSEPMERSLASLTAQERRVLTAIADGDRSGEIARREKCSIQQVHVVLRRARRKAANQLLLQYRSSTGSPVRLGNVCVGKPYLTRADRQTLALAALDLSTEQIAYALCTKKRTIDSRLCRIYAELGVTSRPQAVQRARVLGQIE